MNQRNGSDGWIVIPILRALLALVLIAAAVVGLGSLWYPTRMELKRWFPFLYPVDKGSPTEVRRDPPRPKRRPDRKLAIGTTAQEIIQRMGKPDEVIPGRVEGDAILRYGDLRLDIRNGRLRGEAQ